MCRGPSLPRRTGSNPFPRVETRGRWHERDNKKRPVRLPLRPPKSENLSGSGSQSGDHGAVWLAFCRGGRTVSSPTPGGQECSLIQFPGLLEIEGAQLFRVCVRNFSVTRQPALKQHSSEIAHRGCLVETVSCQDDG